MKTYVRVRTIAAAVVILGSLVSAQSRRVFSPHEKAFYADAQTVQFVNPGLVISVTGATIASDGTITTQFTLTDPNKLPLDNAGVTTPGVISTSFIAAFLPNGQGQYTSYTTRTASGAAVATTQQPSSDSGGTLTAMGNGAYQYVFKTKAPANFDKTATHTIGIYGNRNLTTYNLGTNYASATFDFVPGGGNVTHTRDVIKTASCDQCHDQLAFHGGSRRGMNMCVLCHQPQLIDPDSGQSVDMKFFIHKIHMGAELPSVQAGGKYAIGSTDWSKVEFPADIRRCQSCHQQNTGAAQATAYMTNPTRVACGSCHDDVNFTSGKNHPGGPQPDDKQCANCHIPKGELDFDASIVGAHVVPTDSTSLSGINLAITSVTNGKIGSAPTVAFTLLDNNKKGIALSALGSLSFTMAGPTTDYGNTKFGSATTPGYVTESALTAAKCDGSGNCTYQFTNTVPTKTSGTYAIGGEARRTETLQPGTTSSTDVQYGAFNPVAYFSVDGSPVVPRRQVVAIANCNLCHVALSLHGSLRSNTEYCVMCHNPANTDVARRPTATDPAQRALPNQGINMNLLVHRIHYGINMQASNRTYIVIGFGGSTNDFSGTLFPAFTPKGQPLDTRNCANCHVNGSEQNFPTGLNQVTDPQGPINPIQPVSSSCSGCHVDTASASHFLSNTNSLGESCTVCHGSSGAFSVGQVHAQY
jgi:OmcA/MtrC family decaheme c-type cytochrome